MWLYIFWVLYIDAYLSNISRDDSLGLVLMRHCGNCTFLCMSAFYENWWKWSKSLWLLFWLNEALYCCLLLCMVFFILCKATPSLVTLFLVTTKLTKGCRRVGDLDFRTSGYTDSFCNKTLDFLPLFLQRHNENSQWNSNTKPERATPPKLKICDLLSKNPHSLHNF